MSLSGFSNEYDASAIALSRDIDDSGEPSDWEEDDGSPYTEIIVGITEAESQGGSWPGWSLDRSRPGVVVITTPSGRRYACNPEGDPVAMPAD